MLFQYFDHSKDVKHDISDNDDSYECTPIDVLFLFCLDLNIFVLNLLFFVDILSLWDYTIVSAIEITLTIR
jgi:hypothetical protein